MNTGKIATFSTATLLAAGIVGSAVGTANARQNDNDQAEIQQFLAFPQSLAQAIALAETETGGKAMDASWEPDETNATAGLYTVELAKPDGTAVQVSVAADDSIMVVAMNDDKDDKNDDDDNGDDDDNDDGDDDGDNDDGDEDENGDGDHDNG